MKCILYARKSTEDKQRQVQSIPDQIRVLEELALTKGLQIVETIVDEKSAKAPGRPGFSDMMSRIENGEAQNILCWSIDRLSRNPKDGGDMMWLLQQGKIQSIVTPERTYLPAESSILMSVETGRSTDQIRKLSTDVKRGMGSKVDKGWMPGRAPPGYRNEVEGIKGQKRILPHPKDFPQAQQLWRMLLNQRLSLAQLHKYAQNNCLLFRNGKPMSFSTFHRIFNSKFYCGLFLSHGEWLVGAHEPMITQKEFEEAQCILHGTTKIREKSLQFDLKGLLQCGGCDACITAERHVKRLKTTGETKEYRFYRCAHRKVKVRCTEKPLAEGKVVEFILKEIETIMIPADILNFGLRQIAEIRKTALSETGKEKRLKEELMNINKRLEVIGNNMAEERDGDVRLVCKQSFNRLTVERKSLLEELQKEEQTKMNPYGDIYDALSLIINAKERFQNGSAEQKKHVVRGLGSNWKLKDQKLHYEPYLVPSAVRVIRQKYLVEISSFEPYRNEEGSPKSLPQELITSIWSG